MTNNWPSRMTDSTGRDDKGKSKGTPKQNGNKGVMKARRFEKRQEAEERNARTPDERRSTGVSTIAGFNHIGKKSGVTK